MFYAVVWLLIGAIVGCLASLVMRLDSRRLELIDIAAGGLGALVGGWLWTVRAASLQGEPIGQIYLPALLLGAIVLLIIVHWVRRRFSA